MSEIVIRPYRSTDSVAEITSLLHRAYAPLLEAGMRFSASHQDEATTLSRIEKGHCLMAEIDGRIVGTVTIYPPRGDEFCEYYRRAGVMHFGQFGVEPGIQGGGIGRRMLQAVEDYARSRGAVELALDTSERAAHLIERYERWGFRVVDSVDWHGTNYVSVVMSKAL